MLSLLSEMLSGLETGYDISSVHTIIFGGSAPRRGEAKTIQEKIPTIQHIKQCTYIIIFIRQNHLLTTILNHPFRAWTDFICQNPTSVDVRF